MNHDGYPNSYIRDILERVHVIATVGASAHWNRPSYFAMKYLQAKGYRIVPVNPKEAGGEILGATVYAGLSDIPEPVDMVQLFRPSEAVAPFVEEAIACGTKIVWMQLGVRNDAAAARAEDAGLSVVMNRCAKIEYGRLNGELGWSGINTGVISAKRRAIGRR
jgi:predicted CoA-binding protein